MDVISNGHGSFFAQGLVRICSFSTSTHPHPKGYSWLGFLLQNRMGLQGIEIQSLTLLGLQNMATLQHAADAYVGFNFFDLIFGDDTSENMGTGT